MFDSDWLRMF